MSVSVLQKGLSLPEAREWLIQRRSQVRPWLQFVNTSNFRTAGSMQRLSRRAIRNLEYFQSNYLCVFIALILYCLITSPLLLLAAAGSGYAARKLARRSQEGAPPLKLFGRELSAGQQYICVAACSLPLLWLAGAGAAVFWTLGASCTLVGLHAATYNIDALIAEPEDSFTLTQQV